MVVITDELEMRQGKALTYFTLPIWDWFMKIWGNQSVKKHPTFKAGYPMEM